MRIFIFTIVFSSLSFATNSTQEQRQPYKSWIEDRAIYTESVGRRSKTIFDFAEKLKMSKQDLNDLKNYLQNNKVSLNAIMPVVTSKGSELHFQYDKNDSLVLNLENLKADEITAGGKKIKIDRKLHFAQFLLHVESVLADKSKKHSSIWRMIAPEASAQWQGAAVAAAARGALVVGKKIFENSTLVGIAAWISAFALQAECTTFELEKSNACVPYSSLAKSLLDSYPNLSKFTCEGSKIKTVEILISKSPPINTKMSFSHEANGVGAIDVELNYLTYIDQQTSTNDDVALTKRVQEVLHAKCTYIYSEAYTVMHMIQNEGNCDAFNNKHIDTAFEEPLMALDKCCSRSIINCPQIVDKYIRERQQTVDSIIEKRSKAVNPAAPAAK